MTITTLPTRNPADLGAALYDARTPNANELAAVNVEKIKDRLIEVATEIGLSSGATSGSINEMRAAFTSGAYSSILRRVGSSYGSQRLGGGVGAPTVADGSDVGYAPGSWWVQVLGLDNPSTLAFWLCIDATKDAAVWIQLGSAVTSSVEEIAIADGATLSAGDAVAFASGRATASDARAGHVVPGYIGQCVTGGTGDAGGTVFARVAVAGIAPASGLTEGLPVYLSTSDKGNVTTTVPSGLGALWQRVGLAISSTEFALQIDAPIPIDFTSGTYSWIPVRDHRRRLVTTITASATLSAATEIAHVSTALGAVSLTLPDPAIAYDFAVKKTNTGTNGITLVPHDTSGSGPTIEGGSAGASLVLPGSTSAARGYWYLYSDGANWWTA